MALLLQRKPSKAPFKMESLTHSARCRPRPRYLTDDEIHALLDESDADLSDSEDVDIVAKDLEEDCDTESEMEDSPEITNPLRGGHTALKWSSGTEEIFGPVQSIFKFSTTEEVIERANETSYGLAAGILTNDMSTATVVAHALQVGVVWINSYYEGGCSMPFGGYKQSGIGREMGEDGILEYTQVKSIVTKIPVKIS